MQKNVANQQWRVFAFNRTTLVPVTGDGPNITATIKIDGGAAGATNDANPTEASGGFYDFDLTQAESNGDHLKLVPTSSTADVQVIPCPASLYTDAANHNAKAVSQLNDLAAGAQMDLVNAPNATALTAIGAKVEAMVLDEGDATALLAAIAAKIEEFLINEGDATATIAAIATACNAAVEAGQVGTDAAAIAAKLPSKSYLTGTGNADGDIDLDEATGGLASDALDNIAGPEPTGVPSGFLAKCMWLVQRFWKAEQDATTLKVKNAADATVTTQALSEAGGTQTLGAPT